MFGSNPFGQSSSSPFGSQPVFGQPNNAGSNPFAPQTFGGTNPFGSQTGGSIFGGTSTGVFGAQSSSPLGSTSVFGASSSPAFGSSTPTFGASSGSAFGNSSSAFGGSSVFGQKPAFGGFGSTNTQQTSPFGGSFQPSQPQSQPAFGSNMFGSSTPFGAPSQPAFGASSSPAFGTQTTTAFGGSTPAFGSTASPAFGSTSGGFGASTSPFGASTPAFGASSTPAFGASSTPAFGATASAFGATSSPAFGATSSPAFGATSSPAFGSTATPAFGAPSAPSFNFGSSPAFGQSTSAFGNSPFGTSSFGAQTSTFGGAQTPNPAFGNPGFSQSAFGGQRGGTRVTPYSPTPEADGASGTQPAGKLESISAMPAYKEKSHEELKWEDYQLGDKGGPAPANQTSSVGGFGNTGFPSSTPAFGQTSSNLFSSSTSSNLFAPKAPAFSTPAFGPTPTSSPFGVSNTSNLFGSASSGTTSLFGNTAQAFGANSSPSLFSSSTASGFGSPSIFGPSSAQASTSTFGSSMGFGNTQSSPLFQSTTPTLNQTSTPFGQTSSAFGQSAPGFGQSNLFSSPSTGFGNIFSSSSSQPNNNNALGFGQATPSIATPFQSGQQPMSSGAFNFNNFGQSQSANTSGFGGTPGMFGSNTFGQMPATQSAMVAQPAPITNPFGTLPSMPQMSIARTGTSPTIQYGISSIPVVDRPTPVRISSPLTSWHFSQRRLRMPLRKYHPKNDGPKVPFFADDEETPSTPKADAFFVPRENPRALIIRSLEQKHSRPSTEKSKANTPVVEDAGNDSQNGYRFINEQQAKDKDPVPKEENEPNQTKGNEQKTNGSHPEKSKSYITLTGQRAGEAAIVYEHGADIEALMPKLRHSDYFTEPRIQELAAKERSTPGFCRHVKDFIVGRNGYGSIKFFGETDVRRLDLEALVQFNNREVIVYMDDSKKPPVGQGLNKPAEVTLLNIKCVDKKTGQHFTEGARLEKYKEMLKRKAVDQGAEFVSYDAVKGEWKFRVSHF